MDPLSIAQAVTAAGPLLNGAGTVVSAAIDAVETTGVALIKTIYHVHGQAGPFFTDHVVKMKQSDDPLTARGGEVLSRAIEGFGIGFVASTVVIGIGQALLGNPLLGAAMVGSAVVLGYPRAFQDTDGPNVVGAAAVVGSVALINPISMTCAALGAIYWGWTALSEDEQDGVLRRVSAVFEFGIELVRSIVNFVINAAKSLFSKENLKALKNFVRDVADTFGRSLGEITRAISDRAADGLRAVRTTSADLIEAAADHASDGYVAVRHAAGDLKDGTGTLLTNLSEGASHRIKRVRGKADTPAADPE